MIFELKSIGSKILVFNLYENTLHVVMEEYPLKVEIKNWRPVATWHWDINDENCGICQYPFDGFCPECKRPGDDCPPAWGKCRHAYHMHCIMKWVGQQNAEQLCPMCRQMWEFV